MPNGEGTIVGNGIEDIFAIRTDTGMTDAPFREQRIDLGADGARRFIEGDAHQTVLELVDIAGQTDGISRTIIYVFPVRREGWEGLELQTVAE